MILRNCHLVNVLRGEVLQDVSIWVEGEKIQNIKQGRQIDDPGAVDLKGCYVLPGLFNMHVHLSLAYPSPLDPNESPAITALRSYSRGIDALRAGVTSVRTVSELHQTDIILRSMINQGWVDGPNIIPGGRGISATGGHGPLGMAVMADGADEFLKAARAELAAGASHIKIFLTGGIGKREEKFTEQQITEEEIRAAVSATSSKGTYVCAHAGDSEPIMKAVEAGVKCFEHCYRLNQEAAKAIREKDGYIVPTLCVTLSEEWYRRNKFEEWKIEKSLTAGKDHLESIRTAVRAGVKLLNGTDIPPGDTLDGVNVTVREAEFMVEAGLSPIEAIRGSTLYAAQLCQVDKQLGAVAPNYQADLIAVESNPIANIHSLRTLRFVMKKGRVIRNDLHSAT